METLAKYEYKRALSLLNNEAFWQTLQLADICVTEFTNVSILTELSTFVSKQMECKLSAFLNVECHEELRWKTQANKFPDLVLTSADPITEYGIEIKACFIHAKEASSRFWESVNSLIPGNTTILVVFWCLEECNNNVCKGKIKVYKHLTFDAHEVAIKRGEMHHKPEEGRVIKEPSSHSAKGQRKSTVRALVVDEAHKDALISLVRDLRLVFPKDHAHSISEQALVNKVLREFTFSQDSNCGKIDRILGSAILRGCGIIH